MAKDIKAVFAKAEHADAEHHYLRAAEAWAIKTAKKAGHELHAAAVNLENGFTWADHKVEAAAIKIMDGARQSASKLIEGAGWAADEVTKAIEYLGKEID